MHGKAQREPSRRAASLLASLLASASTAGARHLANMIKQNTVTECPFLSVSYFVKGYFQGIGIAGLLS